MHSTKKELERNNKLLENMHNVRSKNYLNQVLSTLNGHSIFFLFLFLCVCYQLFSKDDQDSSINLNELSEFGKCLLKEAGKRVVHFKQELQLKGSNFEIRAKSDSNRIIVDTLNAKFKNLKVVSRSESNEKNEIGVEYYMRTCDNYNKEPTDLFYASKSLSVTVHPFDATKV